MLAFRPVLCILVAVTIAFAAKKERDWQTGKVLDAEHSRYMVGLVGSSQTNGNAEVYGNSGSYNQTTFGSQRAVYRRSETILIEGAEYVYFAEALHKSRWTKTALLTVNAPVKYAVQGRKLFVIDDESKEHELEITKRVLKTPAADSPPK